MFDVGFPELIVLAGLGLIILGPQRLPRVAAQLGRWVGQARRMSRTLMYQLRQEVNLDDPKPFSARPSAPADRGGRPDPGKSTDSSQDAPQPSEETAENGGKQAPGATGEAQDRAGEQQV